MTGTSSILTARPALPELEISENAENAAARGVRVAIRHGLGIATVIVRKNADAELLACVGDQFGLTLPQGPRRASSGDVAFVGTAPGTWLATCDPGGNAFAASLRQAIGAFASVSDQTDAYGVLCLRGPNAHEWVSKLAPIDLHPRVFKVGDVAVTALAHMGATLWRRDDLPQGSPVFEVAFPRSMAVSFWHALVASAADSGLR